MPIAPRCTPANGEQHLGGGPKARGPPKKSRFGEVGKRKNPKECCVFKAMHLVYNLVCHFCA